MAIETAPLGDEHQARPRRGALLAFVPAWIAWSVVCFLAGLAASLTEPAPTLAIEEVVAMKPVEGGGSAAFFTKMPIESLYGVPSARTEPLWPTPGKK